MYNILDGPYSIGSWVRGGTVFPKGIRSAGPKIGPDLIPYDTGISRTPHRGRSTVARYGDVPEVSEGVGFARNERVIPRGAEQVERGVVSVPQGVAQSLAPNPREGVEATRVVSSTRGIH